MAMATSHVLLTVLLLMASVHGGVSAAAAVASTPLDHLCGSLGSFYVTPELCTSSLCVDPGCRTAPDAHSLAVIASRLAVANATAARSTLQAALARGSLAVEPESQQGMQDCLQLYAGAVQSLRWSAGSVAARRYRGAREVLEVAQYIASGCAGMAGEAALPKENDGFSAMTIVAHAIVASIST